MDAGAGVGNLEFQHACICRKACPDMPALGRELKSIGEEVVQDLPAFGQVDMGGKGVVDRRFINKADLLALGQRFELAKTGF
jgi:hypothetical protein